MKTSEPYKLLHLHPQGFSHSEAEVVGDMTSLTELRLAIIHAQEYGQAQVRVMAGDGESYVVNVRLADAPRFHREPLPYVEPLIWEAERRHAAELAELMDQNRRLRVQVQELIRCQPA